MELYEREKEVVAIANSDNAAFSGDFDSSRAELSIVAFHLCFILNDKNEYLSYRRCRIYR